MPLLVAQQEAGTSCSQYSPCTPRPMGVMWSSPGAHSTCKEFASWLRSPEFSKGAQEPIFLKNHCFEGVPSKPARRWSGTLLPTGRLFAIQTSFPRQRWRKLPVPLVIRCAETRGTHGNCFLRTVSGIESVPMQRSGYAYLL